MRWLLRAPLTLYRHDLGWMLGRRFVMVIHVGRRSGRQYRTVLEVIGSNPASGEVVVMAGLGRAADWYRNIQAGPAVEIAIGRERFCPVTRQLDERDAAAAVADYERRNRWAAPVVRRVLSWLVGWRYDGSAAARERLVQELPVVAFRPSDAGPGTTTTAAMGGDRLVGVGQTIKPEYRVPMGSTAGRGSTTRWTCSGGSMMTWPPQRSGSASTSRGWIVGSGLGSRRVDKPDTATV